MSHKHILLLLFTYHTSTNRYINQGKHTVSLDTTILLFNDSIFMLLEKDNKYYVPQIGDLNLPFIYLKHVLVKPNAVDRKSIFIINTEKSTAEMYRLMFDTCEEAVKWQTEINKSAANIPKGQLSCYLFIPNHLSQLPLTSKYNPPYWRVVTPPRDWLHNQLSRNAVTHSP